MIVSFRQRLFAVTQPAALRRRQLEHEPDSHRFVITAGTLPLSSHRHLGQQGHLESREHPGLDPPVGTAIDLAPYPSMVEYVFLFDGSRKALSIEAE